MNDRALKRHLKTIKENPSHGLITTVIEKEESNKRNIAQSSCLGFSSVRVVQRVVTKIACLRSYRILTYVTISVNLI